MTDTHRFDASRTDHRRAVIVISWIAAHARSDALARELGADAVFMSWAHPGGPLPRSIVGWARSTLRTWRAVRSLRPGALAVVMAPPVFAPIVALGAARRRGVAVAIDAHSGAFNDPRWRWSFRLMARVARAADMLIVTNHRVLDGVDVSTARVRILHDPLHLARPRANAAAEPPYVVFPASGAADEPLTAAVEAGRLLRGRVEIVVTGAASIPAAPGIVAVGWLERSRFLDTVRRAGAVLALTTRAGTMQRAAYEALELGVPIVCSDTPTLRDSFGEAAVFADSSGPSIARCIEAALDQRDALVQAGRSVAEEMNRAGRATLRELVDLTPGRVRRPGTRPAPDGSG